MGISRYFTSAIFAIALLSDPAHAGRVWEKLEVPGAQCADGSDYYVWISRKDPKKIVFSFEGGGACWGGISCKPRFRALDRLRLNGVPPNDNGMRSEDAALSPVPDYTMIHIPYCTGDVHIGTHIVKYGGPVKATIHHVGRINVTRAMEVLHRESGLDFEAADQILIYGESAGALGATYHIHTIAPYLRKGPGQDKVFLGDSPGLHWGRLFWIRFRNPLLQDYKTALAKNGVKLKLFNGNIARVVPNLCKEFPEWRFGFLQGSFDLLMSAFGVESPLFEYYQIYSKKGLHRLTEDPNDNCSAYVADTGDHTFLTGFNSVNKHRVRGVGPLEFARDILHDRSRRTYP